MTSAAVVVAGGGILGASAAYHLAARGVRDVVIVDRAAGPGRGSTGAATGGYRAQYASAVDVRLSLLSREALLRFEADTGVDPGYEPVGYLWLAREDAELERLRAGLRVQHAEGLVEAVELAPTDIARHNPYVSIEGVAGATFCPTDGFIRPLAMLEGYLGAAQRLGVRVEWSTSITGFEYSGGAIARVATSRGSIDTGAVVNAAGAWAASLAALAGEDLPVAPLRRQVAATVPTDAILRTTPMTLFVGDGFHLRARDGRVLFLLPTPGVSGRPFDVTVEPAWIDRVSELVRARVPALANVPIDRAACWAGLYEMSPDGRAILCASPGCSNLYFINGCSGHGVMHAPALGRLLGELMTGGPTSMEISALHVARFAASAATPSRDPLG